MEERCEVLLWFDCEAAPWDHVSEHSLLSWWSAGES